MNHEYPESPRKRFWRPSWLIRSVAAMAINPPALMICPIEGYEEAKNDTSTQKPPETKKPESIHEERMTRSQMMKLIWNMADSVAERNYRISHHESVNEEIRWYIAGLVNAVHTLEQDEHLVPDPDQLPDASLPEPRISYNELRGRVDAYTEFEAIPDGEIGKIGFASRLAADLIFKEVYKAEAARW